MTNIAFFNIDLDVIIGEPILIINAKKVGLKVMVYLQARKIYLRAIVYSQTFLF